MTNPQPTTLSINAMATRFELVLYGDNSSRLRAAGEEAMEEIETLDRQLSLYRAESEISWINAHAAGEPVKVDPRLLRLLEHAAELSRETEGAFDVTVAPLMRAWGLAGDMGAVPEPARVQSALERVGMEHIHLNAEDFTVRFDCPGVEIDLGAIGKGYAIERAVEVLRESGVTSALIHGGTSTIYAIGAPPGAEAWRVGIRDPLREDEQLDTVDLRDNSLSVSAVHGKSFRDESREYGHVMDPRTGEPTMRALLAAVTGPSPTDTDALSTALLVMGEDGLEVMARGFAEYRGLVAVLCPDGGGIRIVRGELTD